MFGLGLPAAFNKVWRSLWPPAIGVDRLARERDEARMLARSWEDRCRVNMRDIERLTDEIAMLQRGQRTTYRPLPGSVTHVSNPTQYIPVYDALAEIWYLDSQRNADSARLRQMQSYNGDIRQRRPSNFTGPEREDL